MAILYRQLVTTLLLTAVLCLQFFTLQHELGHLQQKTDTVQCHFCLSTGGPLDLPNQPKQDFYSPVELGSEVTSLSYAYVQIAPVFTPLHPRAPPIFAA